MLLITCLIISIPFYQYKFNKVFSLYSG